MFSFGRFIFLLLLSKSEMIWVLVLFLLVICMGLSNSFRLQSSGKVWSYRAVNKSMRLPSINLLLSEKDTNNINESNSSEELNANGITSSTNSSPSPEGYLPSDFNSLGDAKQTRVLLYIGLALLPCLALIPFFMSRDFVPPIDAEYSITSTDSRIVEK